jgi:hypothetical protein
MKKLIATLALVFAPAAAFADGNGGPAAPISAFTIWQQEGSQGKAFTPLSVLAQQAHNGPTQTKVTTTTPKTLTN